MFDFLFFFRFKINKIMVSIFRSYTWFWSCDAGIGTLIESGWAGGQDRAPLSTGEDEPGRWKWGILEECFGLLLLSYSNEWELPKGACIIAAIAESYMSKSLKE